ncbi:unnamed protein product [Linum tenue]|uniref:Protein kinase domain-containing protein n=1 Tax=Linum tenue TaxID=586396 RepID=A0AAV0IJD1_9ROSI|nr:unnamed protein product [Linum tenue]
MFKVKIPLPLLLFLHLLLQETGQAAAAAAAAESQATEHCESSSCGEIPIRAPFRLTTDPGSCDDRKFNLSCESNTTVLLLHLYSRWTRYYVKAINYNNSTVRLVDDGVVNGNCSSLPNHSWVFSFFEDLNVQGQQAEPLAQGLALINCDNPVVQSTTTTTRTQLVYVETSPCIDLGPSSSSSYALIGGTTLYDLPKMCSVEMTTGIPYNYYSSYTNVTFQEIHRQLEYGFELTWLPRPDPCRYDMCFYGFCYCYGPSDVILWIGRYFEKWIIILVVVHRMILLVLGTPAIVALLVYKWRRRHESAYHSIEEFLQNQAHLMPIRYTYYHIKKITGGFKDKLGQGGFGSVYKAKLRGGGFAAVKMLRTNNKVLNPTAAARKGQDFMNEVATIGRIHHANVVRLIGYCSEGSKQVLVYEFMPNGSLDKHISHDNDDGDSDQNSSTTTTSCLSLEQLYRISLGVARGIEYLHSGCDMQILHFDIKPHNILLDENFTPKVSDFGLARLNQAGRDNNIATLTAARGTIGYMAPELFYKNIGGVSYKADVYSFGMLLLEMTGKRGNLNAAETDQSTAYFPSWVHNEVSSPGTPIVVGEVKEEEDNIAKKMVMVGLWCIQTKPDDRPPMNKVVEMLEGDLESLQLPPKPVLFAAEAIRKNEEGSSSSFVSSSEYTQSALSNQYDDDE